MHTVYVIGVPGVGKSTVVAAALDELGLVAHTHDRTPLAHARYRYRDGRLAHTIQLGAKPDESPFPGTDRLSMSVNPVAIEWVQTRPCRLLLGEGDRLANRNFLHACTLAGTVTVVWLDSTLALARARSDARSLQLGRDPQTESWWRGRATKVTNLVLTYNDAANVELVPLEASRPVAYVARDLADLLAPHLPPRLTEPE